MTPTISILAIEYLEPSYEDTRRCIEATRLPVIYIHRSPSGTGSLAEAINRGMSQAATDYVWIVTNITFESNVPELLLSHIGIASVIHPTFSSDHSFKSGGTGQKPVPFVEFTAAMVKRIDWLDLDESMPYWGHDWDYGYKARAAGQTILIDYDVSISHTYIRNSPTHPITQSRLRLRRAADRETKKVLFDRYGKDYRALLFDEEQVKRQQAMKCKRLIIDCDGVLTDGRVQYSEDGSRVKEFHSRDITALMHLKSKGWIITIHTQSKWPGLKHFAERFGANIIREIIKVPLSEAYIYIGDDFPDIEMMKAAAVAYCPADANEEVKKYCTVLHTKGGYGVISELKQLLL